MKRYYMLLFVLALILPAVLSCQHRKSAEEGERFLQEVEKQFASPTSVDSLAYIKQQLLEAEYNYRFSPEQQVRLKIKQLIRLAPGEEVGDRLLAEAEAQAIRLGNDSLLMLVRRQTFLYYTKVNDTINALRLFHQQEPLLVARNETKELNLYHTSLVFLYARLNQPDNAIYWHHQTRRMNEHKLASWYGRMSQYLLEAGRNDEALLYADSCLSLPRNKVGETSYAYPVKGQILTLQKRIPEALALYAAALQKIESSHKKSLPSTTPSYSYNHCILISLYAELLHQTGRTREAIPLLEKILLSSYRNTHYSRTQYEVITLKGKRADQLFPPFLLSECYRSLGQTEKALRYTHIADSLQRSYSSDAVQARYQDDRTRNSNQYLSTRLQVKEYEVRTARLTQDILWSTVAFLLLVIAGGVLGWQAHRRRLRLLFNQLVRQHAGWIHTQALLSEFTGEAAVPHLSLPVPPHDAPPLSDTAVQTCRRHYLCALRIMEEQRPFTDPAFDLVALARLVGTNRTQLSSVINQQARVSFSNWLAEYRINFLIQQLNLHPDVTIDELYLSAGFAVRSTFYRQFRQVTGLTPKQYLKERKDKRMK